jgi:ubiquinone biosynthesis monooxygenase Coq7
LSKRRPPKVTGEDRLPGDPDAREIVDRIIRVDHAGEYGAVHIYKGQLAVLGQKAEAIAEMAEQERHHLERFDELIVERRVRPTLLSPVWRVAGFALGAGSALLGEKAAMACTAAIEEVIDEHYASQVAKLGHDETALREELEAFRAEEVAHRDTALAAGAREAPAYEPLTRAIKAGSRLAIWLSERI